MGRLPIGEFLFVDLRVVVVVEVLLQQVLEPRRVGQDRVRSVQVAVRGVLDEGGLREVEALTLALAGFDEWCERGIDWVVRRLRPIACHGRTLPRPAEGYASPGVSGTSITPSCAVSAPVASPQERVTRSAAAA